MRYGMHTEQYVDKVLDACRRYGESSIIALAGVPGAGKSYVAAIAAQRLTGEPTLVREIQFHPSYTYEEFIEGMRIDSAGGVGPEPGVFLEWNERAAEDPENIYVLLIEELTRANLPSVLGELMTYIEHRSRPFFTMYSRRAVTVASNLVILSTYNPIDRSAIEIDAALLRRLRILEFPPSTDLLSEMLEPHLPAQVIGRLSAMFAACKSSHAEDFDHLMPFGHGVFAEIRAEDELHDLWKQRLVRFIRNPVLGPHPFADTIEAHFPWRDASYRASSGAIPAPGSAASVAPAGSSGQTP